MPGIPAIVNKKAVELGIAAALLTNSEVARVMTFDKKNYFYPDLPTGHQITQLFAPICQNGCVEIETSKGKKNITLKQIHIEEDAGKLIHDTRTGTSLIDFNRTSVPLIEIVSNPDFNEAEEVIAYLEKLRSSLSFAGVSDCKMQEGSMRCDVNISVRPIGTEKLGTRAEIKNMNSMKAITAAIEYEANRQIEALETGDELVQETRRWDDNNGVTLSMRGKEEAADYRYFPNPEIMPVVIGAEWVEAVRASLPESAEDKLARLMGELGLSEYESKRITGSKTLSDIFDSTLKYFNKPKDVSNWILEELLSIAKGDNKGEDDIKIDSSRFAKLIELVDNKTINRNTGKTILVKVLKEGIDPAAYVEENQLAMVNDTGAIEKAVDEVLAANTKSVEEYRSGSQKVLGFLVGQTMKKMGGKADPVAVNEIIRGRL